MGQDEILSSLLFEFHVISQSVANVPTSRPLFMAAKIMPQRCKQMKKLFGTKSRP
jgi:hypothetical protein